ncbi:cathecol O-methyltransferase 1 [Beta vulgaris subsp. vulgaris]|uniref:cathecol O-methyltransferase 1 n=1 Tax=Beta vulgaris subsp. vulgaris TaxID=3555 RepID=UPI0020375243|nr:cathecol O-methyltransferase 1 [Beta vulgaris subsp. vulgaris]
MGDVRGLADGCTIPLVEEEIEENYGYAFQIAQSMALPMVMHTIVELDVLGIIARGGPGCELLASEIVASLPEVRNPSAASMLDRMLWLLATYKVVTCSIVKSEDGGVKRKYGLAPVAKYFVPNEDGVSLAPLMSLNQDTIFVNSWCKLKEAVLEGGIPFNMIHGMHAFEYPSVDPKFNEIFNKAMYHQSTYIIKKVLTEYKGFTNIKQLVDVGGGLGHTLRIITSKHPNIQGVNFDLSHVIEQAPTYPGIEHVSGDMFESVPKGDAIVMKWILHDWNDECCLKLLKNCYKALPENGKVIIIEATMADESSEMTCISRAISQLDVSMMTQNPGGKERTKREFEELAKAAGFAGVKFESYILPFWVMEFYK